MNTTQNQITEADVAAFLLAKAAELSRVIGDRYVVITPEARHGLSANQPECKWVIYVDGGGHQSSETLVGAAQRHINAMAPDNRAASLREQAAKMLAEADKLSAKTAA